MFLEVVIIYYTLKLSTDMTDDYIHLSNRKIIQTTVFNISVAPITLAWEPQSFWPTVVLTSSSNMKRWVVEKMNDFPRRCQKFWSSVGIWQCVLHPNQLNVKKPKLVKDFRFQACWVFTLLLLPQKHSKHTVAWYSPGVGTPSFYFSASERCLLTEI